MLNIAKEWVLARWAERTTWDGEATHQETLADVLRFVVWHAQAGAGIAWGELPYR